MTVRELIQELRECPKDAPVSIVDFYGWHKSGNSSAPVQQVTIGKHSGGRYEIYLGPLPEPWERHV